MSEKRFELDVRLDMSKLLIDNATNKRYHLLLVNDIEEIVDVLNEQQNTIHQQTEQHKARLDLLIDEIGKLQMEIVELNDENRELQKKIRVLSAHLLSDECALTDFQIRKIKGELNNV